MWRNLIIDKGYLSKSELSSLFCSACGGNNPTMSLAIHISHNRLEIPHQEMVEGTPILAICHSEECRKKAVEILTKKRVELLFGDVDDTKLLIDFQDVVITIATFPPIEGKNSYWQEMRLNLLGKEKNETFAELVRRMNNRRKTG